MTPRRRLTRKTQKKNIRWAFGPDEKVPDSCVKGIKVVAKWDYKGGKPEDQPIAEKLWWKHPGYLVKCEACTREFLQSQGVLFGAQYSATFAADTFLCRECFECGRPSIDKTIDYVATPTGTTPSRELRGL